MPNGNKVRVDVDYYRMTGHCGYSVEGPTKKVKKLYELHEKRCLKCQEANTFIETRTRGEIKGIDDPVGEIRAKHDILENIVSNNPK